MLTHERGYSDLSSFKLLHNQVMFGESDLPFVIDLSPRLWTLVGIDDGIEGYEILKGGAPSRFDSIVLSLIPINQFAEFSLQNG